MKGNNVTVYFFTLEAPFGQGEVFVKNEINLFLKYPEIDLVIVPTKIPTGQQEIDCTIDLSLAQSLQNKKLTKLFHAFNLITWIKVLKEIRKNGKGIKNVFRDVFDQYVELKIGEKWARNKNFNHVNLYSFWLTNAFLGVAKGATHGENQIISRGHRFDLYHYTQNIGFFPFRGVYFQYVNYVLPASEEALTYLRNRYNLQNLNLCKLGVSVPPFSSLPPKDDEPGVKLIVSCSFIRKVKRVDLIARHLTKFSIKNSGFSFKWIHFGDGEEKDSVLKELAELPENFKFELKAFTPNEELLKFYSENYVDVFINLSESEGQPVSIMEAMAHGIPCLATNVGGVNGIVSEQTGRLINKDFLGEEFDFNLEELLFNPLDRSVIRDFILKNNSIHSQVQQIKSMFVSWEKESC